MFKTKAISLGNSVVDHLEDDDAKDQILRQLYNDYQIYVTDKNYIVFKANLLRSLQSPHVLTVKTAGNPYWLYITKFGANPVIYLIDKKIKTGYRYPRILLVRYRFSSEISETLLDGELLKTFNNEWVFVLNDIHCWKGKLVTRTCHIIKRYHIIHQLLRDHYQPDLALEPCPLQVKTLFQVQQFDDVVNNFVPMLPYPSQGVLFHPLQPKRPSILYPFTPFYKQQIWNTTNKSLQILPDPKAKSAVVDLDPSSRAGESGQIDIIQELYRMENNLTQKRSQVYVDFQIKSTPQPDIYELYLLDCEGDPKDSDSQIKYGIAHIPTLKCSKWVKQYFQENADEQGPEDKFVSCSYCSSFKKWEPMERSDRVDSPQQMKNKIQAVVGD